MTPVTFHKTPEKHHGRHVYKIRWNGHLTAYLEYHPDGHDGGWKVVLKDTPDSPGIGEKPTGRKLPPHLIDKIYAGRDLQDAQISLAYHLGLEEGMAADEEIKSLADALEASP